MHARSFRLRFGKLVLVVRARDVAKTEHSRYELTGDLVNVGRDNTNDVVLPAATVSGRHARLERRADTWHIVDLKSLNGTWVGGGRIDGSVAIDEDSVICVCDFTLRLEPLAPELFVVAHGHTRRVRFGSRTELTIGRDASHDLALSDAWISSTHALIALTDEGIVGTCQRV